MWELLSFVQGKTRKICINELMNGPKTPIIIAKKAKINLSHISRALRELEERDLVVCRNPDASKNRFYEITEKGKQLWNEINKIK